MIKIVFKLCKYCGIKVESESGRKIVCNECTIKQARIRVKKWRINNPEKAKAKQKECYLNKREYYLDKARIYRKEHGTKRSLNGKISSILRARINRVLKGKRKYDRTLRLLGCSLEELKIHIKKQFKSGMTWKNHGKWHIDHIRPCSSFDLSKEEEQYKCFNYKNLQPLWAKENLEKHAKW